LNVDVVDAETGMSRDHTVPQLLKVRTISLA
jgi:hypothetical protein